MSEPILISTEYTLIIDTDGLSEVFAKKLCAYCTGFIDETESDLEFSNLYYLEEEIEDDESSRGRVAEEKNPFFGSVGQRLDEDQLYSPCCVWLNKNYGYNANGEYDLLTNVNLDEYNFPAPLSVGIFFDTEPDPEQILKIKERSVKFFDKVWPILNPGAKKVTVEDFRLVVHTKYGEEKPI